MRLGDLYPGFKCLIGEKVRAVGVAEEIALLALGAIEEKIFPLKSCIPPAKMASTISLLLSSPWVVTMEW